MGFHHVFHRCWPRLHRLDPALTISNFCFLLLGGFSRLPTRLPRAAKEASTAKSQGTHAWVFCCSCRPRLPRRNLKDTIRNDKNEWQWNEKTNFSIQFTKSECYKAGERRAVQNARMTPQQNLALVKDASVPRVSCLPSHLTLSET